MDRKPNPPANRKLSSRKKCPLRVVITEATSYIGRSLAYRLFTDRVFGSEQEIVLSLYDDKHSLFLESVAIEITDCAPPLLKDIIHSNEPSLAFADADVVFSIGTAREYNFTGSDLRSDPFFRDSVLECKRNAVAIENYAKRSVRVITLGNTAATVVSVYAPSVPKANITAVTLAIQKFVAFSIARKTDSLPRDVKNLIIWGTNSKSVLAYCNYLKINGDNTATQEITSDHWRKKELPKLLDNAFSKCNYRVSEALALAEHCKHLILGTPESEWVSMIVASDGSYGVTAGVYFSFPVYCKDAEWQIVKGLCVDDYCERTFRDILRGLGQKCAAALEICREVDQEVGQASRRGSRKSIIKFA